MRLDDGQADGDELAEELKNLLRGHHVLFPDDVLHLHQPQQQEVSNQKQITRSPNPPPLFNTTNKPILTLIRAVASWPASSSLAMSRRICRSCSSRLFRSSLIRGIDSFSRVLLLTPTITKKQIESKTNQKNPQQETNPPKIPSKKPSPLGAAEPAAAATGALEEGVQHLLRPNSTRRSERGENGSRLLDRSLAAAAQVEGSAPRGIRFDLNSSGGDGERWEMMRWRRPRRRRGPVYA